ncbi:DUF2855 family protein [Kordiimonas laminariae]|uniref:DUF2855 family protein n=1 Tax=Kordiimonas laminariae TaxID=2917717 RepID=UPI001FF4DB7F|nr:DUF2855 family protein [Kordiimonas laminariae]MCK0068247.1 DUF2855 family protein [Kordiimonas laminariae]
MTEMTHFLVDRADIHKHTVENSGDTEIAEGEVLLKVDHFAFTANNTTYAAFGVHMKYWDFFPAREGMGRVPVWGFADVVASKCEGVEVGERLYGYYPMSSHLKVQPVKASAAGFFDGAAHRQHLSPIYNFYNRTTGDPAYRADMEGLQMVFRPLFMTSFLIDDFLDDNGFFGAEQIVLSSASSKTAYGLAFLLAMRGSVKVIGLTSGGNVDFVKGMGSYGETVTYGDISTLDASKPTVYVDMAGNGDVRRDVHVHFGDNLKYSCSVGASHWDQMGSNDNLPGAQPTLFFAPAQGQKRQQDWGAEGFQARTADAWIKFITKASGWTNIVTSEGTDKMGEIYDAVTRGTASPQDGHILKF